MRRDKSKLFFSFFFLKGVIGTEQSWNEFCGFGSRILQFQCGRNMFCGN